MTIHIKFDSNFPNKYENKLDMNSTSKKKLVSYRVPLIQR